MMIEPLTKEDSMTHTPTVDELLALIKENQQVLQVFNYPFVKDQFYRNAAMLKAAEQKGGA